MELRQLVAQCVLLSMAGGLIIAGLAMSAGHREAAFGVLFGAAIGAMNQVMLGIRVAGIGTYGNVKQTQRVMVAGTGMRFAMIGMAAYIAIRFPGTLSLAGFVAGLMMTMAVATVQSARWFLRGDR